MEAFALTLFTITPLMRMDDRRRAYCATRVRLDWMVPLAKKMLFPANPRSMYPSRLSHY